MAIVFAPTTLADSLSETAGYKAGLALSIEEMCEHLADTDYPKIIMTSESGYVRLRPEEYESLFYKLLHRIGVTDEEYDGDILGIKLIHKYKGTPLAKIHEEVSMLFVEMFPQIMRETKASGAKAIDPTPIMREAARRYGKPGLETAYERIMALDKGLRLSPNSGARYTEWSEPVQLAALFASDAVKPERGTYIDQRYIDYLSKNPEKLGTMHWRKFEELTAEFFARDGFQVELGPGRNDDGVDIRVWKPTQEITDAPLCLIQCKRERAKVGKVVVKGLAADVAFEGSEYGVLVTTSELSPGARTTILARGYPIHEVNRAKLPEWLGRLRTVGTGIVRV
jgi:restriction system protein